MPCPLPVFPADRRGVLELIALYGTRQSLLSHHVRKLVEAGPADVEIRETHRVHDQATSAIVRARKPAEAA